MDFSIFHWRPSTLIFLVTLTTTVIWGADWPQWRGPERTGSSAEIELLKNWPDGGPPRLWSYQGLGAGHGAVAVQGDQIFVQGKQGKSSFLFCLNRSDGRKLWVRKLGEGLSHGRGDGPRSTPTIDGNRVYAFSENGDLACFETHQGNLLWHRNVLEDFRGRNPYWLFSESPLVDDARVIVSPGGFQASVVALNKMSGETIWKSEELSDGASYCSAITAEVEGLRIIITYTDNAVVGLRASDGKLMWTYQPAANGTANVATPVFHEGKVFLTTAYGTGCALLNLTRQQDSIKAREIYFNRIMQNHHGGVVLVDGFIYGFSNSILTCLNFKTGKRLWRHRSVGKGSIVYADGHLYLLGENHVVGLAEATPDGYRETGRFRLADSGRPSWAHPVISDGKLYIRTQGTLTCFDIKRY